MQNDFNLSLIKTSESMYYDNEGSKLQFETSEKYGIKWECNLNDFNCFDTIKKFGCLGEVTKVINKTSEDPYLIKLIMKSSIDHKLHKELSLYFKQMYKMNNEKRKFCLLLENHFEDEDHLYLLYEYPKNGSLENILARKVHEGEKWCLVKDVYELISYFHKLGHFNLPLYANNIFFGKHCKLKICFSFENLKECEYYIPPETLLNLNITEAIDYWRFGVIMYVILSNGQFPFLCNENKIKRSISSSDLCSLKHLMKKQYLTLISFFLQREPEDRMALIKFRDLLFSINFFENNNVYTSSKTPKELLLLLTAFRKKQIAKTKSIQYFIETYQKQRKELTKINWSEFKKNENK
jgi:serine/threonine protein kinase